jgi:transmembrane sensor
MSEHHADTSRAMRVEAEAAEWLQRQQFWAPNDEDKARFDEWFAQSLSHRIAYWRLKAGFERSGRLTALQRETKFGRSTATERNRLRPLLRFAAAGAVAALVAGVAGLQFAPRHEGQVYETQVGGRQTIVLTDGSKIDLNTGTMVRVNGRHAELLRGEAFFDITHNARNPFVVMAAGRRIVDLGTKFAVRAEPDGLKVSLVQGSAQIEDPNAPSQPPTVLRPGDIALATHSKVFVVRNTQQDLTNELGWRRGVLVFHQTTLAAAAAEFNRYNRKKLVIGDAGAAALVIGATFPTDDIEAFARTAKNVFGLRIEDRGDEIVISH